MKLLSRVRAAKGMGELGGLKQEWAKGQLEKEWAKDSSIGNVFFEDSCVNGESSRCGSSFL